MECGDVMGSDDITSSSHGDYVTSSLYHAPPDDTPSSGRCDPAPEYATISRLRQHDPPSYPNHSGDSIASSKDDEEEKDRDDRHDEELDRREHEDKIEVLSVIHDDGGKESNGCPPGAGWVIGAAAIAAAAAAAGGDSADNDAVAAERNAKILKEFEDKPREKDECLVDCIYYTTTCCECTIL